MSESSFLRDAGLIHVEDFEPYTGINMTTLKNMSAST